MTDTLERFATAAIENATRSCTYLDDLDSLAGRGLNDDLIVLLYKAGPVFGGEVVKTLKAAGDGQLAFLNKAFEGDNS